MGSGTGSVKTSHGLSVKPAPYGVTLAAGDSTAVTVYVSVPAGATVGTTDVTTVTATSVGDGSVSDSVVDSLTVYPTSAPSFAIYLPLVVRNH